MPLPNKANTLMDNTDRAAGGTAPALPVGNASEFDVDGTKVVGAQQSGMPAAATDPTTTMALANALRTIILAHGLAVA